MIGGFLGTVIGLERAVALGRGAAYAGALASGAGGVALLAAAPRPVAAVLLTAASLLLCLASIIVARKQLALFTVTMAAGAACWTAGNLQWLAGAPIFDLVLWWMGSLVVTIAGERLELSRFRRPSAMAPRAFAAIVALLIGGMTALTIAPDAGTRMVGAALLCLAVWLVRYDVARRTVHAAGLPRYVAVCLLLGYAWLASAGVLLGFGGRLAPGPAYDAALHALLVGFVFSMIFGHAPVIVPAVLRVSIPFRRHFYLHLALLHASLVLRVIGDVAGWAPGCPWGGLGNATAIALFLVATVGAALAGQSRRI